MIIEVSKMSAIPEAVKRHLRVLSLGPYQEWGFWSWTFHDGSTWAAVAFDPDDGVVGWAALTFQADALPVLGCYVDPGHRDGALASDLVHRLLECLVASGTLDGHNAIFASLERWPAYRRIVAEFGLVCLAWQ